MYPSSSSIVQSTAMSGGDVPTRVPPAAGIEGGVLLTSGGAGRSRSDDPGWSREMTD